MAELSFEGMLHQIAKGFSSSPRITFDGYFELLEWAKLFSLEQPGSEPWRGRIGFQIEGVSYALLFLNREAAAAIASKVNGSIVDATRGRDILQRFNDGQGVIVDSGTASEVRIAPAKLTELKESLRIKPVRQEATPEWLAKVDAQLAREAVPQGMRAKRAIEVWKLENGFQVVSVGLSANSCRLLKAPVPTNRPTRERQVRLRA